MNNHSFDRVLTYLYAGRPVIVCDDDDREAEGDLLFAATHATPTLVNFTLTYARGVLCISMKEKNAERLALRRIQSNNVDKHDTPFGVPITYADGESGVSAASRATGPTARSPDASC